MSSTLTTRFHPLAILLQQQINVGLTVEQLCPGDSPTASTLDGLLNGKVIDEQEISKF